MGDLRDGAGEAIDKGLMRSFWKLLCLRERAWNLERGIVMQGPANFGRQEHVIIVLMGKVKLMKLFVAE